MQSTRKKKAAARVVKKRKRVITTIRKYAKNIGIDVYWLHPENLDQPLDRSVVGYMAIRSAHRRGIQDTRDDVMRRLGFRA